MENENRNRSAENRQPLPIVSFYGQLKLELASRESSELAAYKYLYNNPSQEE